MPYGQLAYEEELRRTFLAMQEELPHCFILLKMFMKDFIYWPNIPQVLVVAPAAVMLTDEPTASLFNRIFCPFSHPPGSNTGLFLQLQVLGRVRLGTDVNSGLLIYIFLENLDTTPTLHQSNYCPLCSKTSPQHNIPLKGDSSKSDSISWLLWRHCSMMQMLLPDRSQSPSSF